MADFTAIAAADPRGEIASAERAGLLALALELADGCRGAIDDAVAAGIAIDAKPDRSLVTSADRAAERAFRDLLASRDPQAGIIGEEYGRERESADLQWVVDPIDGTAEFAAGLPLWGTIIGCYLRGWPLVGVLDHPALGVRAHAAHREGAWMNGARLNLDDPGATGLDGRERLGLPSRAGFNRYHDEGEIFERLTRAHPNCRTFHTCYAHLLAASGGLDAAVEWEVRIWDLAATRLLVEEAGGRYLALRTREQQGVGTVYSAAFGRPALVEAVAAEWQRG